MTPQFFAELFTREGLRPFQPRPGARGLIPMLEVHTDAQQVLVFALALDNFNDWDTRRAYLASLGRNCYEQGHTVTACRFGSEAWMRTFTPEEHAARGDRLIETYPDRQEMIIVMGETATGAINMAQAPLHRRPDGTIERLGVWKTGPYAKARSPLLEAFWRGYKLAATPSTG